MKITRLKRIQKNLSFYSNNFGFRKPYQILVDGTFCYVALKDQLNIQDQLKIYFGEDFKLLTTQCVVLETEKLGKNVYGAMLIVKQFPTHSCSHKGKPVTGSCCFESMIGTNNSKRYIIATQDRDLQDRLRRIPGVPLLYFHGKAPVLEAPSDKSQEAASQATTSSWGISKYEESVLTKLKKTELGIEESKEEPSKKRKRKSGPNPLSCQKKKKLTKQKPTEKSEAEAVKSKRRRKKKKIPQHIKEELLKMSSA